MTTVESGMTGMCTPIPVETTEEENRSSHERNDIYGSVEFNERTERLKGNVEIEREINDNLGVRGAYGRDNAGYDSGRLGGRASGDDGWVDLQLDFNEKTNRLDGRLKSRYKVSDNTTAGPNIPPVTRRKTVGRSVLELGQVWATMWMVKPAEVSRWAITAPVDGAKRRWRTHR